MNPINILERILVDFSLDGFGKGFVNKYNLVRMIND